jgi:hypothetical protein
MCEATGRDPGDEDDGAQMPRRVYDDGAVHAVLGVRTVLWLEEHRDRLIQEEYGVSPRRLLFWRWLYARGALRDD